MVNLYRVLRPFMAEGGSWLAPIVASCLSLGCAIAAPSNDSADVKSGTSQGTTAATSDADGSSGAGWDDTPIYSSGNSGGEGQTDTTGGAEPDCLRLMSWGSPASGGVAPGQSGLDAMVHFLNEKSSASAVHMAAQVPITEQLLSSYDVVLLQNISAWVLSESEVATFSRWIKAGGAVVALSGYEQSYDVQVSNRLLSFSGLSFAVTAPDTALALGDCGYCLGSSRRITGFDPAHPISEGMSAVGSFMGRSIQGDGQVVISEAGLALAVAKEIEQGRVFLFHDDWITYVAQWTGEMQLSCTTNPTCAEESPELSYQVAHFWFNALSWLVPSASECFVIEGDETIR